LRAGSDVIDAAHLQTVGRQTSVAEHGKRIATA